MSGKSIVKRDYDNAVNAVGEKSMKVVDVVPFYADAIRAYCIERSDVGILRVNTAILSRWTPRTLDRIKKLAWAEVEMMT